jgi:hypothetical protein
MSQTTRTIHDIESHINMTSHSDKVICGICLRSVHQSLLTAIICGGKCGAIYHELCITKYTAVYDQHECPICFHTSGCFVQAYDM